MSNEVRSTPVISEEVDRTSEGQRVHGSAPVNTNPADLLTYRSFLWLAGVVLFLSASAVTFYALYLVTKHGDVTSPESAVVSAGLRAIQTGRIYTSISSYPYTAPAYGPFLYLGLEGLAHFAHGDFGSVLLAGRIIVFVAFLLLGPLVYLCARQAGSSRGFSVLSGLAVLSGVDFEFWNASVRPDVPALALGMLALYFALPRAKAAGWNLAVSGLCVAAEVLLKQSMLIAGLSIALWLLSRRRFRDLGIFVGVAALPVAATIGILSLHEPVLATMGLLRNAPKDAGSALHLAVHALIYSSLLLAFGVGGLFFGQGRPGLRLLQIYFVVAWVLPALMLLQVGADTNYLFEGWSACALLTPFAMEAMRSAWPLLTRSSRLALLCWVLLAAGLIAMKVSKFDSVHEYPRAAQLQDFTVLSDISYLSAQGKHPELLDPFMNHSLEVTGHWSPQPILANLDRQYYDVAFVLTRGGAVATWRGLTVFDRPILAALNEKYDLLCVADSAAVLVPRNRRQFDVQRASEVLNERCAPTPALAFASVVQLSPGEPLRSASPPNGVMRLIGRISAAR